MDLWSLVLEAAVMNALLYTKAGMHLEDASCMF